MNINPHYAGNSLEIDVPLTGPDGEPYPLTGLGFTYKAICASKEVTRTLGAGIEVIAASTVRVTVPPDMIDVPGRWSHAITVDDGGAFEQTLWTGLITCVAAP